MAANGKERVSVDVPRSLLLCSVRFQTLTLEKVRLAGAVGTNCKCKITAVSKDRASTPSWNRREQQAAGLPTTLIFGLKGSAISWSL
jgi:hypothetical protein